MHIAVESTVFRKLRTEETDLAHGMLLNAADWLLARGIRQWTVTYPKDRYLACQEMGWNYALESDGEVAAVVTLSQELPAEWARELGPMPIWWLSKLATAPKFHGRGVGRRALVSAIAAAFDQEADRLCLDCVYGKGFLVDFYRGVGFQPIDRRDVQFPTGFFDMVLMELQMFHACSM